MSAKTSIACSTLLLAVVLLAWFQGKILSLRCYSNTTACISAHQKAALVWAVPPTACGLHTIVGLFHQPISCIQNKQRRDAAVHGNTGFASRV